MSISSVKHQSLTPLSSPNPLINWKQFNFVEGFSEASIMKGSVRSCLLKHTHFSFVVEESKELNNRQIFIEKIFEDVTSNCPKDEPLVVISIGSDRLLTEYILGKLLIENGFGHISFLLVDPIYLFSDKEALIALKDVLKDFRDKIEEAYVKTHKEKMSKENIKFLSRSQNILKYFPNNANVVVIESFPPYAKDLTTIRKHKLTEKNPEDLLATSYLLPQSQANAVTFIPGPHVQLLKSHGVKLKEAIPIMILKSGESAYYCDWGCKIQIDGTYHLSFSGEQEYLESVGFNREQKVQLTSGEVIFVKDLIPTIKQSIEKMLFEQIATIKGNDSKKELTQENITFLLTEAAKIIKNYMPDVDCFYSADYSIDLNNALNYISSHASHHYRKRFILTDDMAAPYKIEVTDIK